jgi:hypothetical protein
MRVDTMIDRVVARFIGTKHERDLKQIQPLVIAINALAPEFEKLSDAELLEKTVQLRAGSRTPRRLTARRSAIQGALQGGAGAGAGARPLRWCAKRAAGNSACATSTCS